VHYFYEPLGVVSGDYCDVVRVAIPLRRVCACCSAIVAGKGVSASLLMSHMHAMFRSVVHAGGWDRSNAGASQPLTLRQHSAVHYATLVCVETSTDGDLEICNAGHCSPLVFQTTGSSAISAEPASPWDSSAAAHFPSTRVRLEVGDILLLYSDGFDREREFVG